MAPKADSQLIELSGKAYLKVPGRIEKFREAHPQGVITTDLISTEPRIIIRASIHGNDGTLIATGYGTAPMQGMSSWKGREIEKAETAAVGRALGFAGYGTLAAFADDDRDNLADAPIDPPRQAEAPADNEPLSPDAVRSLVLEGKRNGMTDAQVLAALGCSAKWSEYTGTMSQAREIVRKAADALKAANGAAMPGDAFGGAK
jgi:hypothetical protein